MSLFDHILQVVTDYI
jgi:hypothetical protein